MKYGVTTLSIVPGRGEPADSSEMTTQLLFGDHYKVIDERAKWVKVRVALDNYECWIDRKQHQAISEQTYLAIHQAKFTPRSTELLGIVQKEDESMQPIVLGSALPFLTEGTIHLEEQKFDFKGEHTSNQQLPKSKLVENACMFLNAPYLWGGKSPLGIDCSGYAQIVYLLQGISLPRDAYQQAEIGQTLSFIEESEPGDLAFFDNDEGHIVHVGFMLENNYIIHASGHVRIDRIDHQGIFNVDTRTYSHKLRLIKKII